MSKLSVKQTFICFFFIFSFIFTTVMTVDKVPIIVAFGSSDDEILIWSDDFEGYAVNVFPDTWVGSGNAPGGNSVVTSQESYDGVQSLCLEGQYGGCWEAIAYRSANLSNTVGNSYVFEFAIKIGGHVVGCHSIIAEVGLNTGADWTTEGRELIDFTPEGNTTYVGGKAVGTFTGDRWYVVKIKYHWVSDSTIQLYCWIDGEYKGNASVNAEGFESNLNFLALHSGDGVTWFDDVSVSSEIIVSEEILPSDGLIGYWDFNEGSGSIVHDISECKNNGTVDGNSQWVDGVYGTALRFDGDDKVVIPDNWKLNPSQITVCCWVNFNRLAYGSGYDGDQAQFMVCKGGDGSTGAYKLLQGGSSPSSLQISFSIGPYWNNNYASGYPSLETDHWYHIVGTYDGQTLRCYLDGILLASKYVGNITVGNTKPLYFSYDDAYGYPYYLDGLLDEISIYDRALNEEEIKEIYFMNNQEEIHTNNAPLANFSYNPEFPSINEEIIFNPSNSVDQDGTIVDWLWDFGDGTTSNMKNPAHYFSSEGRYQVSLSITDDDGAVNSISKNISIINNSQAIWFTENIKDYGLDENNDGYYENLIIEAEVNIRKEGKYTILAAFRNASEEKPFIWNFYDYDSAYLDKLNVGFHTIYLKINHNHINNTKHIGIFYVNLEIYTYDNLQKSYQYFDHYEYNTSEYDYRNFNPSYAKFVSDIIDYGYDSDNDGIYNWLVFEIKINITKPSYYNLKGILYYYNQSYSGRRQYLNTEGLESTYFNNGTHTVYINFSSLLIKNSSYSGNYLCEFLLKGGGYNNSILDRKEYETLYYDVNDFGGSLSNSLIDQYGINFDLSSISFIIKIIIFFIILFVGYKIIKILIKAKKPIDTPPIKDPTKKTLDDIQEPKEKKTERKTVKKKKEKLHVKPLSTLIKLQNEERYEEILCCNEDMTSETIEEAFVSLIFTLDEDERIDCEERNIINQAYSILSNQKERKKLLIIRLLVNFSEENKVYNPYREELFYICNVLLNDPSIQNSDFSYLIDEKNKVFLYNLIMDKLVQDNKAIDHYIFSDEKTEFLNRSEAYKVVYTTSDNETIEGIIPYSLKDGQIISLEKGKLILRVKIIKLKFNSKKLCDEIIYKLRTLDSRFVNVTDGLRWNILNDIWRVCRNHYSHNQEIKKENIFNELVNTYTKILNGVFV